MTIELAPDDDYEAEPVNLAPSRKNNFKPLDTTYGRLTVVSRDSAHLATCVCSCGSGLKQYRVLALRRKVGATKSCGCLHREVTGARSKIDNRKHGLCNTPTYNSWHGMQARCHCSSNKDYPRYGARGIYVCARWRDSFENFLADMGERPSPQHSLDRWPDNNGPYAPDNCRWATVKEQARNRRTTRRVIFNGEEVSLSECCETLRVHYATATQRMGRGWSVEDALLVPAGQKRAGANDHQGCKSRSPFSADLAQVSGCASTAGKSHG